MTLLHNSVLAHGTASGNEVLFVLNASHNLQRRPDVAFVSYARWSTSVVAREPARNVVPDLAIEIVSPTNLAEEIDRRITDYFQSKVRLVWVLYPDSGRVYVYQLPTHVSLLERTDTLDAAGYCPAFGYPLPNYTKPWPNQNKPSAEARSLRRRLEVFGHCISTNLIRLDPMICPACKSESLIV
jgi:hypothetical protein